MFPEDMEYFCGKCLGWDWSMSLQGVTAGPTPPNARQNEYLTMLGRYERLRLERYFTEDVKARLRTPKEQFRLAQDDKGNWQFRPTDYLAHKVTSLADGTAAGPSRTATRLSLRSCASRRSMPASPTMRRRACS